MNPKLKVYIETDLGGQYWAYQREDNVWVVNTSVLDLNKPLQHLPKGWEKITLKWVRSALYYGVFRSFADNIQFSYDGRAILAYLYENYGVQATAVLRVDMRIDTESSAGAADMWRYETVYKGAIDFTKYDNDYKEELCSIGILNSKLSEYLAAYGDNEMNIPYWYYDSEEGRYFSDGVFIKNKGIKLKFNSQWTSAASASYLLQITNNTSGLGTVFIPAMTQVNTVPYIANDILKNQIIVSSQSSNGEIAGVTHFTNYTNNNGVLQKFVVPATDFVVTGAGIECQRIEYHNPSSGGQITVQIVLSQIDDGNNDIQDAIIADFVINHDAGTPDGDPMTVYAPSFNVYHASYNFYENSIYVVNHRAIITGTVGGQVKSYYNNLSIVSYSDHSTDLRYPTSPCVGYRPAQVFQKIVERLSSVTTDPNGFQLINPSNTFTSTFYSDNTKNADSILNNMFWTSGNAVRVINGIQYMQVTLNSFFKSMFAMYGLGLFIDPSDQNNLQITPLYRLFDKDTEILNLGTQIANLKVAPYLDLINTTLKTGYTTKWQDFSQYTGNSTNFFGVDAFNFTQEYKLPLTKKKGTLDWTADVIAEPYKIETERANQSDSDASSPSSSNGNYIMELAPDVVGSDYFNSPTGLPTLQYYYEPLQFPTAQSVDPTTPPYVRGLNFGEAMTNITITPRKNLERLGALLHSVVDGQESALIAFQKQYWQLYNGNSTVTLSGIETNLFGDLFTEVGDLTIADLPPKLFRPILFKFDTSYPVNLYQLLNDDPYGYITFNWLGVDYKGFVMDCSQNLAEDMQTSFTLLAHPDTVINP